MGAKLAEKRIVNTFALPVQVEIISSSATEDGKEVISEVIANIFNEKSEGCAPSKFGENFVSNKIVEFMLKF